MLVDGIGRNRLRNAGSLVGVLMLLVMLAAVPGALAQRLDDTVSSEGLAAPRKQGCACWSVGRYALLLLMVPSPDVAKANGCDPSRLTDV